MTSKSVVLTELAKQPNGSDLLVEVICAQNYE